MSILRKYNSATSTWDPVVIGAQGNSGTIAVTAPLTNTGTTNNAILGIDSAYMSGAAGKNVIINGGFDIWQRGTSFSVGNGGYTADRWTIGYNGTGIPVVTQQAFTPGTLPSSNGEGQYYARITAPSSMGTTTQYEFDTRVEDVRTFAGQVVTFSFWAKSSASKAFNLRIDQNYGTGGSSYAVAVVSSSVNLTTSWARYSVTWTMPSLSGKTIGAGSHLVFVMGNGWTAQANETTELWGVQFEAGATATPFSRAGGTLQGELAACQRYYIRWVAGSAYASFASGYAITSSAAVYHIQPPVPMRATPSSIEWSALAPTLPNGNGAAAFTGLAINYGGPNGSWISTSGSSGLTQGYGTLLTGANNSNAYLGLNAEL